MATPGVSEVHTWGSGKKCACQLFSNVGPIDLFRGACAVKGNVPVAGHVKRVDHRDAFNA